MRKLILAGLVLLLTGSAAFAWPMSHHSGIITSITPPSRIGKNTEGRQGMAPTTTRTRLAIDQVLPNPSNDNIHPKELIDLLVQSIRKFGQPRPILVRQQNRMIIAGHGVHQAMRQAGEAARF